VKITKLSLVAILAGGMVSVLNAEVNLKTDGQAVIYYQTADSFGDADMFDHAPNSKANAGLQLNISADLGDGFGMGYQGTFLGTLGLEKNAVGGVMQQAGEDLNDFATTKIYLTKKLGNTTFKAGRQELPKKLSPLAFSEGWNVFKNTFDAVVLMNGKTDKKGNIIGGDIPDTLIVGAYVSKSNNHGGVVGKGNLGEFTDMADGALPSGAYMLTIANQSVKQVPITLSYYSLPDLTGGEEGYAVWGDVQVDAGIPVKFGLQGGQLSPENGLDETTAFGAKLSGQAGPVSATLAYTTVDDGDLPIQNVGTNVKTPLYTQMILNQKAIKLDADTAMLKLAMQAGPGKAIAQYSMTTANEKNLNGDGNDYNELDVIYKFKALGSDMLAAYVMQDFENKDDPNNIIRFWIRHKF
jgi:hypothetical protein